jgi:hypothetical protein
VIECERYTRQLALATTASRTSRVQQAAKYRTTHVQLGNADIIAGRFKTFETKASLRDHFKSLSKKATTFE